MESLFLIKLAISFLVGSAWIVIATILADKLGSKIGGLIVGFPSTVIFGLFFLAWTQSPLAAVQATTIMPIIAGVTCLFLTLYIFLVKRGFWLSLISSLILWLLLSFGLVFSHFNNYGLSLLGYLIILLFSFLTVEYIFRIKSIGGGKIVFTKKIILSRALLSGSVVTIAVLAGKIGGPALGGAFSMFPAMFTSTILITYFSQGAEFSAATMKSTMLSAIGTVIYSILIRYFYLPLGIVIGTLLAIAISFINAFFIYRFLLRKIS